MQLLPHSAEADPWASSSCPNWEKKQKKGNYNLDFWIFIGRKVFRVRQVVEMPARAGLVVAHNISQGLNLASDARRNQLLSEPTSRAVDWSLQHEMESADFIHRDSWYGETSFYALICLSAVGIGLFRFLLSKEVFKVSILANWNSCISKF